MQGRAPTTVDGVIEETLARMFRFDGDGVELRIGVARHVLSDPSEAAGIRTVVREALVEFHGRIVQGRRRAK